MIVNVDLMLKNVIEAEFKKSIKQHICKENYVWNSSICATESNKKCRIYKYLNDCICMKSVFDNLVVTCKDDMVKYNNQFIG